MAKLSRAAIPVLALSLLLVGVPGCAGVGLGSLADILAGGVLGGGDVSGEVRRIDERRQEIEVQSGWGGAQRVRYDRRTQVIYRQRRYDVRSLERGDLVRVRVENDRRGTPYTNLIYVEASVQDRRGGDRVGRNVRLERLTGTVYRIDDRSGSFELRMNRGTVLVILPYDASRSTVERFRRLRRGNRITIEGYPIDRSRVELYRFR
ncbi:MAG: hypothetical protein WD766_13885 [Gemmatimonadota bacterium]